MSPHILLDNVNRSSFWNTVPIFYIYIYIYYLHTVWWAKSKNRAVLKVFCIPGSVHRRWAEKLNTCQSTWIWTQSSHFSNNNITHLLPNLHLSLSASPIHVFNPIPVSWQLVLLLSALPNLLSRGWWWWLCCLLWWWREFSVLKPDGLGLGEWRPNVLHFGPRKPSRQGI